MNGHLHDPPCMICLELAKTKAEYDEWLQKQRAAK